MFRGSGHWVKGCCWGPPSKIVSGCGAAVREESSLSHGRFKVEGFVVWGQGAWETGSRFKF